MRAKRFSSAKAGEIKLGYGKLPHDNPDICFAWGEGCSKSDGNFLHYVMCSPRLALDFSGSGKPYKFEKSFTEELASRGYDLTTIKFSIQKLPKEPQP